MDLHERAQFDFLLQAAVERYVERLEQRNGGAAPALARLRAEPEGEGVWLTEFTRAILRDFLLDNAAGAAFVLRALARRRVSPPPAGTVEEMLVGMATEAFAALLKSKSEEALEQHSSVSAVETQGER